jgi:hypothetical protein
MGWLALLLSRIEITASASSATIRTSTVDETADGAVTANAKTEISDK